MAEPAPRSPLVWVVEDNDQNFDLVEFLLDDVGIATRRAVDRAGFERLLAGGEPADLVLLDINLPGTSGLELLALLRADPRHGETPVVALTAHAMVGDRERFLAAGCVGYLSKPIATATFAGAVRAFLAGEGAPGPRAGG